METKQDKKGFSLRTVLNVYGVFASMGMLLTIYTAPISTHETVRIQLFERIIMMPKEIVEFILFIVGAAAVYFIVVNFYFWWRRKSGS